MKQVLADRRCSGSFFMLTKSENIAVLDMPTGHDYTMQRSSKAHDNNCWTGIEAGEI